MSLVWFIPLSYNSYWDKENFFGKTNMNRICSVDFYTLDYWFTLAFSLNFYAYEDSLELIILYASMSEIV